MIALKYVTLTLASQLLTTLEGTSPTMRKHPDSQQAIEVEVVSEARPQTLMTAENEDTEDDAKGLDPNSLLENQHQSKKGHTKNQATVRSETWPTYAELVDVLRQKYSFDIEHHFSEIQNFSDVGNYRKLIQKVHDSKQAAKNGSGAGDHIESMFAMDQASEKSGCDHSPMAEQRLCDCGLWEWCNGWDCQVVRGNDEHQCTHHNAWWCAFWINHHCWWAWHINPKPCTWLVSDFVHAKCGYLLLDKKEQLADEPSSLDEGLSGKRSC